MGHAVCAVFGCVGLASWKGPAIEGNLTWPQKQLAATVAVNPAILKTVYRGCWDGIPCQSEGRHFASPSPPLLVPGGGKRWILIGHPGVDPV